MGDIDGRLTLVDLLIILMLIGGEEIDGTIIADSDIDGEGRIGAADATGILRELSDLP